MYVLNNGKPVAFEAAFLEMRERLKNTPPTDVGEWQSQKIDMPMRELLHVAFEMHIPADKEHLGQIVGARLPWAEDHFLERVSGEPLNPSPSEAWWPFAKKGETTNADHKSEGKAFSHTYPERMWPKHANPAIIQQLAGFETILDKEPRRGIRFEYGDLDDVVEQLTRSPNTRQAYLPIWFPEDTGAVHGKRVPCTLGYHFIIRDGKLDMSYFMRSTDLLRHFQDDIYLAGRLMQWMVDQINFANDINDNINLQYLAVGNLIFHTANMHIFDGDIPMIEFWEREGRTWY
jgi:hypothetical protein